MDDQERDAEQIRLRIQALVSESSQAELARRAGTSKNNVSRYLRGAKIPIEFGAALVREAGVNPSWLLTGEGASSLADVSEEASETAGELLDLVHAMSAISRMKLGSLAGRERAKTLRELNDALDVYEDARESLVVKTKPIFREMVGALERALNQDSIRLCEELKAGLEQVSRLCPDEELEREMLHHFSLLEFKLFNFDRALKIQREIFYRLIKKGRQLGDADLLIAHSFARMLKQCSYSVEARGICRAALSLASPSARSGGGWATTSLLLGWLDAEHGALSSGLKRVTRSFLKLDDQAQVTFRGVQSRPTLFAGATDAESVWRRYALSPGMVANVFNFACCEENYDLVERAYREASQSEAAERFNQALFSVRAKLLLEARESGLSTDVEKMSRQFEATARRVGLPPQVSETVTAILSTQLARVAEKQSEALGWLRRSVLLLQALPEGMDLPLITQTSHHRNVLKLTLRGKLDDELALTRKESLSFAKSYTKRGYGFIANALRVG